MNDTQRGFGRIFWGFFFVVLDFRINGFDVLPDFVGFALIAAGLSLLVPLDRRFLTARVLAVLLVVLSLTTLIERTESAGAQTGPNGWTLFQGIVDVLDVAMVWLLCGGIIAVAEARELLDLADRARFRRGLYVGLTVLGWLVPWFFLQEEGPKEAVLLVIGLVVLAIVVTILLMGLMLRAGRELGAEPLARAPSEGE